ncbi:MAG: hypothetical protein ACOCX4_08810, partial [Planctomycetota bacterium]
MGAVDGWRRWLAVASLVWCCGGAAVTAGETGADRGADGVQPSIAVVILTESTDAPTPGPEASAPADRDAARSALSDGRRRPSAAASRALSGVLPPPVGPSAARTRDQAPRTLEPQAETEPALPQMRADTGVADALAYAPAAGDADAMDTAERCAVLKRSLARRLGDGFAVVRHGPILLASDLPRKTLNERPLRTLKVAWRVFRADYFDTPPTRPVVIFAFRDRESYRYNLRRLWNETPISPYGHYNYARGHVVCNAATGLGTMVHETVHALMDADMPRAPIWIAEGIASLYEQCTYRDGTLKGLPNWRLPELQRKMDTPLCTPLAEVLTMDDAAFKREKESLHYAMV